VVWTYTQSLAVICSSGQPEGGASRGKGRQFCCELGAFKGRGGFIVIIIIITLLIIIIIIIVSPPPHHHLSCRLTVEEHDEHGDEGVDHVDVPDAVVDT
jgi:hypothetical protein